jgi:hypothetical protein
MSQPWQPQYNPGNQPPPMPQQPPGPPGFGAPPPVPGQYPMQPGYQYPAPYAPYGQQPNSGKPVAAFFLGLLVSVAVSALYSLVIYASYEDMSENTAHTLYVLHALFNGAAVGTVVGLLARRRVGAHISGAIVAMLGCFFGYTNGIVLIFMDIGGLSRFSDMMEDAPFTPAKAWWGSESGTELMPLLGLVVAAAAAWGLAYLIGRNRR